MDAVFVLLVHAIITNAILKKGKIFVMIPDFKCMIRQAGNYGYQTCKEGTSLMYDVKETSINT
jgi:hypothetical protein